MSKSDFNGFPLGMLHFLDELSKNNNRLWFNNNKSRYESELLEPALAYIEAMQRPLKKLSPHFRAVPKRTGGSLMRIYRDTRFAKDKRPYKTNVGIHFRHEVGRDVHAPGYYVHIDTEQVFIGAGIWHPDSSTLSKIRAAIDTDAAAWRRARNSKPFCARFDLSGESLKRPPRGYDADHPLIDDLRRQDHIGVCYLEHDALLDSSIVEETASAFRAAKAYVNSFAMR